MSTEASITNQRLAAAAVRKSPHHRKITRLFWDYKSRARSKNLEFKIDLEFVRQLTSESCHYCGTPPILYHGMDRRDNTSGYIEQNVVACCRTCNVAKSTMTEQEFRTWINNVYCHYAAR